MSDLADYDAVTKELRKYVDAWAKAIKDATADLAKLKAEADKQAADDKAAADLKKQQDAARKDVEQANEALKKNILNFKVSPKADPKPFTKLPDILKTLVEKGGVPLGNTGLTVAPDNWKFDPPPHFKVKSGGFVIKGTF